MVGPRSLGGEAPPRYDRYRREVARGLAPCRVGGGGPDPGRCSTPSCATTAAPRGLAGGGDPQRRRPRAVRPAPQGEELVLAVGRLWDQPRTSRRSARWPLTCPGRSRWPGATSTRTEVRARGRRALPSLRAPRRARRLRRRRRARPRVDLRARPARATRRSACRSLGLRSPRCALVLGDIPSLREAWGTRPSTWIPATREALRRALRTLIDAPGAGARWLRAPAPAPSASRRGGWPGATCASTASSSAAGAAARERADRRGKRARRRAMRPRCSSRAGPRGSRPRSP